YADYQYYGDYHDVSCLGHVDDRGRQCPEADSGNHTVEYNLDSAAYRCGDSLQKCAELSEKAQDYCKYSRPAENFRIIVFCGGENTGVLRICRVAGAA